MAIIVEGYDNSGKSTLAASFGLDVAHPGPRPKSFAEELKCLEEQLRECRLPTVMDRVTAISTPAYTGRYEDRYREYLLKMLDTKHCVLIYCRPPIEVIKNFSRHIAKGYDDLKQLEWLERNADLVVGRYDAMMHTVPHMVYDYTKPDPQVVQAAYDAQFTIGAWKRCREIMAITGS